MISRILIVGGASGIGLAMAVELASRDEVERVYVVDKANFPKEYANDKIFSYCFDLTESDYSIFDRFADINALMITAGFGRLALFKDVPESYIKDSFEVNTIPVLRLVKHYYAWLESKTDFYCGVMVSIAGYMTSELEKGGSFNRILNVSPGSIPGTGFNAEKTDLTKTQGLAKDIISHLENKDDLFIPKYEEVFKAVLQRYHDDFREEGRHSYEYKLNSGRVKTS